MPHLSPSNNRGRSPSSNGCTTTGNGSERAHQLLHLHSVASANNTGADLNLIYNVKPRSSSTTTNQDGGRSLPRPARKNYHQQRSPAASSGVGAGTTNGTISGWRSRSSEAANGGRSQQFMSRSYAAPTISSRTHHQQMQQQQQRQRGQLLNWRFSKIRPFLNSMVQAESTDTFRNVDSCSVFSQFGQKDQS